MSPKNIIDRTIEDWLKRNPSLIATDPFLSTQKPGLGLLTPKYFDTMPEPFWGSTKNNLAVIIHLNPGFTDAPNKHGYPADNVVLSRTNMAPFLASGYSAYADRFPQLCPSPLHQASSDWWLSKMKWLDSIVFLRNGYRNTYTHSSIDNKDYPNLRPFALEIVPWHSNNWSQAKYSAGQISWMQNVVIPLAVAALKGSRLDFILMLGNNAQLCSVLKYMGFVKLNSWDDSKTPLSPYWPQKNGVPTHQNFIVWDHPQYGVKLLNMIANCSKPPRSDFNPFLKNVVFPTI